MDVLIVYASLSGNTEELAQLIAHEIKTNGGNCDLVKIGRVPFSIPKDKYDIVLFGSYTWDDGALPIPMRKQLRESLIVATDKPSKAAVFGTGDTQYPKYCRAVDEIEYHIRKHGIEIVTDGLKIEQFPQGRQIVKTKEWVNHILGGISTWKV